MKFRFAKLNRELLVLTFLISGIVCTVSLFGYDVVLNGFVEQRGIAVISSFQADLVILAAFLVLMLSLLLMRVLNRE